MKAKFILLTASALAVAVSCVKELDITSGETPVVLTIHQENSGASRTQLMDAGTEVYWTPGDAISIFTAPYKNYRFEAQNAEPALSTEFSGTVSGTMPASFVAIYPYSSSNSIINGSSASDYNLYNYRITATIPTTQAATEGSFGPGAFPLAALAQSNSFTVYALAGGVKFSLQNAGICKVVFKSNSGERLSGQIYAGLSTSDPVPGNIKCDNGSTKATLEAAQGSTLSPGVDYFIVLAPGELSVGFTMDFYKEDGTVASVSTDRPVTVKRRTFGVLGVVDEGITDFRDPTPEMVDLGLSVKWASCNVGATSPTDFGGYYAWGETEEKDRHNAANYKYCEVDEEGDEYYTKYCLDPNFGKNRQTDDLFILEKEDDVAYCMYGDLWRMPSNGEWQELIDNCTWEGTEIDGIKGYKITSKIPGYTDKTIFLPATGYKGGSGLYGVNRSGEYLSSELFGCGESFSCIYFSSSSSSSYRPYLSGYGRVAEQASVRPVYGVAREVESISLGVSELTLDRYEEYQFAVTVVPADSPVEWYVQSIGRGYDGDWFDGRFCSDLPGLHRVMARSGKRYASCTIKVRYEEKPVDMGLSVAWASSSLGDGCLFAWGETEAKSRYTLNNYAYWNGSDYIRYNYYDNLTSLLPVDDVATRELGSAWRIPSQDEWLELVDNCSWEWDSDWAVYRITSNITGNQILLPEGSYWAKDKPDWWEDYACVAWLESGYEESGVLGREFDTYSRWAGCSIFPVFDENAPITEISLNETTVTSYVGEVFQLVATVSPIEMASMGLYWESSNLSVATVDDDGVVTSVGVGSAVITVSTEDGAYASCSVKVVQREIQFFDESLNLKVYVEGTYKLYAYTTPYSLRELGLTWKSSNTSVVTVNEEGVIKAKKLGSATITVTSALGDVASCPIKVLQYEAATPDVVNLGLSVKWSSFNLGATTREGYGDFFAWGEKSPKTCFNWSTYKWCEGSQSTLTKYCTNASYGRYDGKSVIGSGDDAATVALGEGWRIPTDTEWRELLDNCTWEWTTINGVQGSKATSNKADYTDKWIFLPATGYMLSDGIVISQNSSGGYWASTLYYSNPYDAWAVHIYPTGQELSGGSYRCEGHAIRPVCE